MGGIGEETGTRDLRRCCDAARNGVARVRGLKERRARQDTAGRKWATAINFLDYGDQDVMMVLGRFGLKSYSLADPANPQLLDEITSPELELPGDPPTDFTVTEPGGDPKSTFWQNEDMDVDPDTQTRADLARSALVRGVNQPRAG